MTWIPVAVSAAVTVAAAWAAARAHRSAVTARQSAETARRYAYVAEDAAEHARRAADAAGPQGAPAAVPPS